jgi:hypothetical protein
MRIGGKKGGRGNLYEGLPRDIIKGGGMGEHGIWIGEEEESGEGRRCAKKFLGEQIREAHNSHLLWEMKRHFLWEEGDGRKP